MPIPSGSFLQNFMKSKKTDGVSEPEVKKTINPVGENAMDRLTSIGSFGNNARDLTKMNGTTDMMGLPSQGAQELAQKVNENEKTGLQQRIAGFLQNRNPYGELMRDTSVIDPVTNQRVNEDFLKLLNNRPDLRQRFNEKGTIFSEP
tara:strand:+ start:293 stop:733 length:441 start_codon:yes stop_codon:yes gene_type:complete